MVQGGVMLGTVISQFLVTWCPVVAKVFLGVAASESPEAHVHGFEHLVHHGLVGDTCSSGVVALNRRGGCGQPISMRLFLRGIMALAQMKRPESSASAAEDMMFLMIWAIVRTGPLREGTGVFSESMM